MQQFLIEELKQQILESESHNNQLKSRRLTNNRPLPLENNHMGDGINGSLSEGAGFDEIDGHMESAQPVPEEQDVPVE